MRIVHFVFSLATGGTESLLVELANEQANHYGVSVVIVNNVADQALLSQFSRSVEVVLIGRRPRSRNIAYLAKIHSVLHRLNPDLIHCHQGAMARLLRPTSRPRVLTIHSTGMICRLGTLRRYAAIFAVSRSVQGDVQSRYGIEPTLVYNGIDTRRVQEKGHVGAGLFRIVQIGSLRDVKGQDVLVRALHYMVHRYGQRQVTLDFIGEGASEDKLKSLAKELEVTSHCRFLGKRDRKYVYANLKEYDLLVQPSRSEGFGLTVAEAMAARVPAIVSNVEGLSELARGGFYCRSFPREDAEDCASQMVRVMKERQSSEYRIMIERARNRTIKEFDIRVTAGRYTEQYAQVLGCLHCTHS